MRENLDAARQKKDDEFYTQKSDVVAQLKKYRKYLKGKNILCNCNDYNKNFHKMLTKYFMKLKLKSLNAVEYCQGASFCSQYRIAQSYLEDGEQVNIEIIKNGTGDFRDRASLKLLEKSDIVITNPPFSLFREYMAVLFDSKKKFLLLGPQMAIQYVNIFDKIQNNKMFVEPISSILFRVMQDSDSPRFFIDDKGRKWKSFGSICWFTNIAPPEVPYIKYNKSIDPNKLDRYDNFNAIDIPSINDIPDNYWGVMGVPITFIKYYNPEQFKIVRFRKGNDNKDLRINGVDKFTRILIQRIKNKGV